MKASKISLQDTEAIINKINRLVLKNSTTRNIVGGGLTTDIFTKMVRSVILANSACFLICLFFPQAIIFNTACNRLILIGLPKSAFVIVGWMSGVLAKSFIATGLSSVVTLIFSKTTIPDSTIGKQFETILDSWVEFVSWLFAKAGVSIKTALIKKTPDEVRLITREAISSGLNNSSAGHLTPEENKIRIENTEELMKLLLALKKNPDFTLKYLKNEKAELVEEKEDIKKEIAEVEKKVLSNTVRLRKTKSSKRSKRRTQKSLD